jgi:hypothetical protein
LLKAGFDNARRPNEIAAPFNGGEHAVPLRSVIA